MRAGGRQSGSCHQVVARGAKEVETLMGYGLTVGQHTLYRCSTGLLGAAQGLVLQRGNTALLVSWGRILVYGLAVALEVFLEIIDEGHRLIEEGLIFTAVHEQGLRTEHFRYLREDGGAAHGDESVGEAADSGVCGDAGESVGAAALHADHQLAAADGLPLCLARVFCQLLHDFDAVCDFIVGFLRYQETDTFRIVFTDIVLQYVNVAVLTAQAQHQHAAGIGMVDEIGEDLTCMLLIVAHLGAAVRVGEGDDALHAAGNQRLASLLNGLGHIVDTAYGGDDPDLVPDADLAVLPAIALEEALFPGRERAEVPIIGIGKQLSETRLHVVGVDPGACPDLCGGNTDGIAVLYNRSACRDVLQCKFVSLGDVLNESDLGAVLQLDQAAFL